MMGTCKAAKGAVMNFVSRAHTIGLLDLNYQKIPRLIIVTVSLQLWENMGNPK